MWLSSDFNEKNSFEINGVFLAQEVVPSSSFLTLNLLTFKKISIIILVSLEFIKKYRLNSTVSKKIQNL